MGKMRCIVCQQRHRGNKTLWSRMRKTQWSLYVINSSQLKVETTSSSLPFSRCGKSHGASGLPKRCIFEGCKPMLECGCGRTITAPPDIPMGLQLPCFLSSQSNCAIFQYSLKEAVKSCRSAVSDNFINILLRFLQTSRRLVKL